MSLVSIKNLKISFKQNQNVVNNVNIEIPKGKTVAIVGESGSGKTLSALSILKLLPGNADINSGSIIFKDKDILQLPLNEIEKIRGNKISTIFQEPMSSLNPLHTIDKQIKEMITTHNKKDLVELNASVLNLLKEVNLEDLMNRPNIYSYELSGGQRQRVMIAMSIANNPDLLIADEPTTALDVTVQQQILSLLNKIQKQRKMSILFISHDLGVVNKIADYIYVMKDGEIIEHGDKVEIFKNPKNPYTKQLVGFQNKIRKIKENKDLSLNKLIDKNLESYCMFVGVPYSDINPSVRDFQTIPGTTMRKKYQRQQIIDRIVEKHRRLVKQKPKEFKKWLRDNEAYYRGPF